MRVNAQNIPTAASHKYVVENKRARVYERLVEKGLGIHFLFSSKNHIYYILQIPVANFCRLIAPQTLPGL